MNEPIISSDVTRRLREDSERFASTPLPADISDYLADRYCIDITSRFGGFPIRNPFGKASGQLSLNAGQVRSDSDAGLGFVILKTVIAQDASGSQSMSAWAIPETRMVVEPITGATGESGWTVTWKGRGWYGTFDDYCAFFAKALEIGRESGMVIVPSCKYHLPDKDGEQWRVEEYAYTTARLVEVWRAAMGDAPMPIEKDFSPTLAGDDRAKNQERIIEWVRRVPRLIRESVGRERVRVGLKLMNAMFDDDFQIEMLRAAIESDPPDWITYANRLFNPTREFDGKVGVAYGGPDLSERNLRILRRANDLVQSGDLPSLPPISATGDILTGRTAVEYARLGASSFQMHTLFQLPNREYDATTRSKTSRTLHRLLFHPVHGYLAWMTHFHQEIDGGSKGDLFTLSDLHAGSRDVQA